MVSEESPVSRQGRRMRRSKHQMSAFVNQFLLAYCIAAPQHEHHMVALLRYLAYDGIGKTFPAHALMRRRMVGIDCKGGIEQKHTLACPAAQVAVGRHRCAGIGAYLLENIQQRRRHGHSGRHRKTHAVGLPGAVIRVLPQNHHLHIGQRTGIESGKNFGSRRKHRTRRVFAAYKVGKLSEIFRFKFTGQSCFPAVFYSYVHIAVEIICKYTKKAVLLHSKFQMHP